MPEEPNYLDELVRLQVAKLRREFDSQSDVIVELDRAGFVPARIAHLIGTTPGTVATALHRAKKRTDPIQKPKKASNGNTKA